MASKNEKQQKEDFVFTDEQRDILLDFVKSHEELYKVQHMKYRDTEHKERLWKEIGIKLNKSSAYQSKFESISI